MYFDIPESLLEIEKDYINKSLENLRENNSIIQIKFSFRSDIRERTEKECAMENITETKCICKAAVESTTFTRTGYSCSK